MPHQRNRHLLNLISKRLKLWPVLALLGPRQVGKSTLLRDQFARTSAAHYLTLDDKDMRSAAIKRPSHFIEGFNAKCLVIDEVQKAPDLFDAIKAVVDLKRVPGRFILSGSTEFSKKTGIRESLTGRIGLFRLYPMTLAETLEQKPRFPWVNGRHVENQISITTLMRRIAGGGMPGVCFLRNADEQSASWDSWLDTTCFRDLQQIRGARLNGELAMEVLQEISKCDDPSIASLATRLKQDARRVRAHVEALEALFVLVKLSPHRLGIGKEHYYLCDSGLARHLGANEAVQFKTWILGECLSQFESAGVRVKLSHYRSSNKSIVDLIVEDKKNIRAYVFSDEEAPGTYTLRTAEAFLKKCPSARVIILAPSRTVFQESKKISIVPWTLMA